jgi:hypothetical protein
MIFRGVGTVNRGVEGDMVGITIVIKVELAKVVIIDGGVVDKSFTVATRVRTGVGTRTRVNTRYKVLGQGILGRTKIGCIR